MNANHEIKITANSHAIFSRKVVLPELRIIKTGNNQKKAITPKIIKPTSELCMPDAKK